MHMKMNMKKAKNNLMEFTRNCKRNIAEVMIFI